jgi:hypothetical protein
VPRLLRPIVACAVASALALTGAASAMAAGWLAPVEALNGTGGTISQPRVAVDAAGNVYAAWIEGRFMEVSRRPVGGSFETPQTLDPGENVISSNPDIAVDGPGNAVVVWTEKPLGVGGTQLVKQARRAANSTQFDTPVHVPTPTGPPDNARLAINSSGQAVLAVTSINSTTATVRTFAGSSTSNFTDASAATFRDYVEEANSTANPPDAAINGAGDAVVAWHLLSDSSTRIDSVYRTHGDPSAFDTRVGLADDLRDKHDPSVAIDSQGNVVATWDEDNTNTGKLRAYARTAGPAGQWGNLKDLGPPQSGGAVPDVGFDFDRIAVAAWSTGGELQTSARPPGGEFAQPPQSLTGGTEQPADIHFETNAAGFGVLVWSGEGTTPGVRAMLRANGGVFGPAATLSAAGRTAGSPRVAVDPTGNAAAVWVDSFPAEQNPKLVTAEYDAVAPKFGGPVSVPATVTSGESATFAAAASDDWSQPTVAWDFGDGGSGTGDIVTHTYTTPGTYTVSVTATDAAGNSVAAPSRQVEVVAPPPPVPPVDTPTEGKDFNASEVSGTVLVSVPKGKSAGRVLARKPVPRAAAAIKPPKGYRPFRPLGRDDNIPVGSILDASRGVTRLTMAANKSGSKLQKGKFSEGVFKTKQTTKSPLTTAVMLGGGNFRRDCRKRGRALTAARRRRPHRQLFGNVKGRFRTRGRHSTATVRGTEYIVKDRCDGTLTIVKRGRVVVRDLVRHRNHLVRAGHRYLARPRR